MKHVLDKLALARAFIKSHPIKKDGRNTYSNYDYFTPEIVSKLVNDACVEANIICTFSLKQDVLGYYGEITTTCLETGEQLVTETRTAKPLITATNETQQMGGMNTYAKRYSYMSLFDIEDNTIDFDAQDQTKNKPKEAFNNADDKPWLNEKDDVYQKAVEKLKAGTTTIDKIATVYKLSKAIRAKLEQSISS